MSSTSLMSFFTRLGAFVAMRILLRVVGDGGIAAGRRLGVGAGGVADGRRRRRPLPGLAPDELVQEGADEAADDRADDVDDESWSTDGCRADGLAEDGRADLAGRVERGAGDRADEDDDPVDDEADDRSRRSPAGACPSTAAPKTVNTRIAVPMTSAAKPIARPALALTETAPRPSVGRVVAGAG